MPRIEVVLGKDGSAKTEVIGHKGPGCMDKTQFVRDALGCKNDEKNTFIKEDYYEQEVNVQGLPSGYCG